MKSACSSFHTSSAATPRTSMRKMNRMVSQILPTIVEWMCTSSKIPPRKFQSPIFTLPLRLGGSGRAQEDVEEHSKDHEQHVSGYAEPEAWVLHELLVVGAEEDVADGHPGCDPSEMSHKRHLGGEGRR
ncbi:hypothetical protein EYF80_022116 [Liparis tanakae]|uniref:Uncharacterized protein n=1 Tax=Liparis tanakae TaxID=230148 RepID=A0A4Z2HS66_9TELE|nr:hypothetical protein EYF80_022116 [Liparis tanakae]